MTLSFENRAKYLRSFIHTGLEPRLQLANENDSFAYSSLTERGAHRTWRVINWSHMLRSAELPGQLSMLFVLIAATFPKSFSDHSVYLSTLLDQHADALMLPSFPITWGDAYRLAISREISETEELGWRKLDQLVSDFFHGLKNSNRLRTALIKRAEEMFGDSLRLPQYLVSYRKQNLLGKEGDRVSVFDMTLFGRQLCLTNAEATAWPFPTELDNEKLPVRTGAQECLEMYSGHFKGVYHFENYVILHLPVLVYDVLRTQRTWRLLPERAYKTTQFRTANDFAAHYVTFRDELHVAFDRMFNDTREPTKIAVLKRWVDAQLKAPLYDDPQLNALVDIARDPERASRLRLINSTDFRTYIAQGLNRKYVRAPEEKRKERKALLERERTIRIDVPEHVQAVCRCSATTLITAKRDSFYIEAAVPLAFNTEQEKYFESRLKVYAPYITVAGTPFVSLDYLASCYDLGLRTFPELAWLNTLVEAIKDRLTLMGLNTTEDWKTDYAERLRLAEKNTLKARHTTFTKEEDEVLWSKWKRYMHDAARQEALNLFPQHNERHLILRGRLMSQIRRANKPIEFLYDIEGLKKFLGKQYPTYSAVID